MWWPVGVAVSIDTLLALTNSPSRRRCAVQPLELSSAAPHFPHQPAIPQRCGWSLELSEHTDQQPLAACTLPRSANEHARAQTRGHDVGLRRQVGRSWRRSKRQFVLRVEDCPRTHIDQRVHPATSDALPPGLGGGSPLQPCGPRAAPPSAAASSSCSLCHRCGQCDPY